MAARLPDEVSMLLPDHNYVTTDSLKECLRLLGENGDRAMVVAGGTDVIFNMRLKLFNPEVAVSIRNLEELQRVEELDDGGLRIGAGARLADLAEHSAINDRYPAFAESIREVASTHIRNMATLGGNICLQTRCAYTNNSEEWRKGLNNCYKTEGKICHVIRSSSKCLAINNADTPLALIVLGATLTLQSENGSREVLIAEFYTDDGMDNTVLRPDELVTHVTIPPVTDRTTFLKLAPRKGMDFATVAVAARCDGTGTNVNKVSIVLGSISTNPIMLDKPARIVSEKGLGGEAIEEAVENVRDELGNLTNLFSRTSYKKQMASVMVRRALIALRES
jgi:4-hydroxybenzoyl-CoA reductase subunit beta